MKKIYRPGDIVYAYRYPFEERDENNQPIGFKRRPAVVLGEGEIEAYTIPVMGIFSKNGRTERDNYIHKINEIRVPDNITIHTPGEDKALKGVIISTKMTTISNEQLTPPLAELPERSKIEIALTYENISRIPQYKSKLDLSCPNHEKIMQAFKDNLIAEKLNFLADQFGQHYYPMKNTQLTPVAIQPLGRFNKLNIYSLQLKGQRDTFAHNFATSRSLKQLSHDWSKPKRAEDWLKEDAKYYALNKNLDLTLRVDPQPHPDRYVEINLFFNKAKNTDLER